MTGRSANGTQVLAEELRLRRDLEDNTLAMFAAGLGDAIKIAGFVGDQAAAGETAVTLSAKNMQQGFLFRFRDFVNRTAKANFGSAIRSSSIAIP